MITLQFTGTDTWASDTVGWYTRSVFTHVDVVLDDGRLLGARINGGVQIRPRDYQKILFVQRYRTTLSVAGEHDFHLALLEQIGKPYDWTAVLGLVMNRNWRQTDRWFCSELVAWAFEKAGTPLLRVDNNDKVTPRDLTTSLLLFPL